MNEFDFRRAERIKRKKRQQKQRRIRFFIFCGIIAAVFIAALIIPHLKNNANKTKTADSQPEIIVNDVVYPMPPEPTYDLLTAINKPDGIKTCYLTFDDGPTNSVTPRILDILRRYNIKATFFTVGSLIEANPDMARRVYDEGHLLANHSYAHNYSNFYADETSFMNEINSTFNLITNITGETNYPRVFRFPGGGFNAGRYGAAKQDYKNTLKNNNIRYCDWNALNGDAEGGTPSAEQLIERVKKSSNTKEDIVVLMHDAAAKSTTADALPGIIEYLAGQGYSFKRLDHAPRV